MSDSAISELRSKRSIVAWVLPLLTAGLLTAVYFRVPRLTEEWTYSGHLMLRSIIVAFGVLGIGQWLKASKYRLVRPSWIRVSHHSMSIPLEGVIYLGIMFVLFTGAMLTKQNTLMLVFAFMAGPFVINGWMTFGMLQAAQVQRQSPRRAMQGEIFSIELILNNRRRFFALWMITIRDEIRHLDDELEANVLFSRVSPRSSQAGQYEIRLSHRGKYKLGPLLITSRFPLGLVERNRVFPTTSELLIYPRIGHLSPHWRMKLVGATELVSRTQPNRGLFHDDFHRLREFRPGDNPRAIHWRSTARRGEVVVREFHQNRDHPLAIILDLYRSPASMATENELVEVALSFVTSLLIERGRQCHDGNQSLVVSGAKTVHWQGQGQSASLESLLDELALIEAGQAANIAELLDEVQLTCSSTTQILLMTTRTSGLPYQSSLTSRVELLKLADHPVDSLLIFDDQPLLQSDNSSVLLASMPGAPVHQ